MYNITKKEKIKAFLKYEFLDTTPKKLTILIVLFQALIIVTAFSIYLMADDKIQTVVIFEMCAFLVTLLATITIERFFYKYNKDGLLYFWFRIVYSMLLCYSMGYALLGFCIFETNGASIFKSVLKFNISFSIFIVIFTIIITKVLVDTGFYNRVKKRHYSKEVSVLGAGIVYFCVNILKHSVDSLTLLYFAVGSACLSLYIIVLYLIKIFYLKKYRFKVKYRRDEDGNRVGYIPG